MFTCIFCFVGSCIRVEFINLGIRSGLRIFQQMRRPIPLGEIRYMMLLGRETYRNLAFVSRVSLLSE
jgi:hypothetical protein